MSVKAITAAFEAGDEHDLPPISRLLLLRLGDWADDYGYAFPSLADLAAKSGASERSLRRHLADLTGAGLVERITEGGGRHRTTLYRILRGYLPDSLEPPGRRRYLARHGNPANLAPFPPPKPGHQEPIPGQDRHENPDAAMAVDPSFIHQDPSGEFSTPSESPEPTTLIAGVPRLPGEGAKDYLRRVTLDSVARRNI